MAENFDELRREMELDELHDATKLTPIEYGRLRGISPQLVYYHIRQGHVQEEFCICNRKVVDIQQADEYFKKGEFDPAKTGSLSEVNENGN
jgi:hypothetical protein